MFIIVIQLNQVDGIWWFCVVFLWRDGVVGGVGEIVPFTLSSVLLWNLITCERVKEAPRRLLNTFTGDPALEGQ
jgi:hypothetical protein